MHPFCTLVSVPGLLAWVLLPIAFSHILSVLSLTLPFRYARVTSGCSTLYLSAPAIAWEFSSDRV